MTPSPSGELPHVLFGSNLGGLPVAARLHKWSGPITSVFAGPQSLRISARPGPDCVRTEPHSAITARLHRPGTTITENGCAIGRLRVQSALSRRLLSSLYASFAS